MNDFISDFKTIIRQANYDNTYKMAWAKALVEISNYKKDDKQFYTTIDLSELAKLIVKYYWNQTIFFNLIQGSNPSNPPVILQLTKDLINQYQYFAKNNKPVVFIKAENILENELCSYYKKIIKKIVVALKANVSYRFLNLNGKIYSNIYTYEKNENSLKIKSANLKLLNENQEDLYDLINYRWSLILENFNSSPRINKKVRIMDINTIPRSNLKRFDEYLDLENKNHICFICGKAIAPEDLSRDHVIPWSYLYSDDLWNIVYVHKKCNSIKNNVIPTQESINKLKKRNLLLKKQLKEKEKEDKNTKELDLAIEKDLVDKFYIGCKQ